LKAFVARTGFGRGRGVGDDVGPRGDRGGEAMQGHHLQPVFLRGPAAGAAQQVEQLAGMDFGGLGVAVDDADQGLARLAALVSRQVQASHCCRLAVCGSTRTPG